jgi:hypothetical protein
MSLKLNEENEVVHFLDSFMEDDSSVANELVFLASNFRRQICGVLDSSFSFEGNMKKKTHKMISLMLDFRFKNICIVSSFVGQE